MHRSAQRPWSCDTFAVRAKHTAAGATLLGKNSDRPARESQPLRRLGARHRGDRLRLAYVEIDDVDETIPHLGSSPYWCWGHEMGVNAGGVAIGNEAVFTRDLADASARHRRGAHVEPGILGMELVRLALERADCARAAVEVMTDLVEQHGQWGAGTANADRAAAAYDNSYLVADADEVWVLETSGRHWASKYVEDGSWALSNELTIRDDWTRLAADLQQGASRQGADGRARLDFAEACTDPDTPLQVSHIRLQRSRQLLADALRDGTMGFPEAVRILRDHYEDTFLDGPKFNPARPDFHTLCMHEHPSGFTWGNTAASVIAMLPATGRPLLWWAAATPCTSVYLPVALTDSDLPHAVSRAGTRHGTGPDPEAVGDDGFHPDSYWWVFQALLEATAGDRAGSRYRDRQPLVRERFDDLQRQWQGEVEALADTGSDQEWDALTRRCAATAMDAVCELLDDWVGSSPGHIRSR
jgi:secernin